MPEPEHLKMIHEVISRLAGNSSQMKRWTVVVVAALLGLAASASDRSFAVIALYAVVALAALDAYYLALERAYRRLYDGAVQGTVDPWSMKAERVTTVEVLHAVTSPSVWLLYVPTAASTIAILLSA